MALRQFVDSEGREWSAFDVVPRVEERRTHERRSGEVERVDDGEEQREAERRLSVGGITTHLHRGAAAGWLCFEHGADHRRLAPIPEHWATATDAELESYCNTASPVKKSATVNPPR